MIDSHCHLNYEPMCSSLDEVILRANDIGIKHLLTISTEDKSYHHILEIVKKYKQVYGTYGIHPHEAKKHKNINMKFIIEKIKLNKKIIGVGETGLDFYYNHSEKSDQIELFNEHIVASQKLLLPLIVHSRSAEDETFKLLEKAQKESETKILIHCFTGSKEFAKKLLNIGAYISASGVITFKKSKELAETFKYIPNDRILIETDSPYLSPEPLRGKPNEPSYIIHTLNFLAKINNLDNETMKNITTDNFFKLFGKLE